MAQLSLSHISCRNLQTSYLNRFMNPSFFVSIAIIDRDGSKRQQEKMTDKVTAVNGDLLAWENEVMEFQLSGEKDDVYEMFYLEFKFFCCYGGLSLTDTMLGITIVPIMDLLNKRRESLSYQINSSSSTASNALFFGTLSFLLNVTPTSTPPTNLGMSYETPWTIGNNQDGYFDPQLQANVGSNHYGYYNPIYPPPIPILTPLPMSTHPQSQVNTQFYNAGDYYYPPVPPQFPQ
ncbi:hypothetical protein ZOSMA_36G00670 [Zostera marina]|uniref:C2 domain-containing protein n=1 Tax=Zostera marina TaxID=29655 RepID=A0A0K9P8I1_ZOSMR|nr:hypothetical protein ZOSMA_36G00670 [Zostera marina]